MSVTSFWGAMLLASTAMLAVGWTGACFLRRRAVWENALWRTVLMVLLILPAAQIVGPRVLGSSLPGWSRHREAASLVTTSGSGFERAGVEAAPTLPAKASDVWGLVGQGLLWLWGAGTIVSLGRLARSAWKVRHWARTASPMTVEDGNRVLTDSARTAGVRPPELRIVAGLPSPVLVGWRRPCILVPNPEVAQQRAVLLHELAHLRRADLWWMTLGRIVCAGWWFHPLAWGVGRRLERSAEDVCDDLVVAWTRDAAAYAGQLLRFARQAGGAGWWPLAGTAITGFRSELGKRVERVLEPGRTLRVAVGRSGIASLTTGAALLLAAAAAVSPSQGQNPVPATRPTANEPATPASTGDEAALAATNRKLDGIVIPSIDFRETLITDGIQYLRWEAKRVDPDPSKSGVDIVFAPPLTADARKKRVSITLQQVSLNEALRQMARQAGMKVVVRPSVVSLMDNEANEANAALTVPPAKFAIPVYGQLDAAQQKLADAVQRKLDGIVIPDVEFRGTRIKDGIEFLRQEAKRLDKSTDTRGVTIVLNAPPTHGDRRATLSLKRVPLGEALRQVVRQADLQIDVTPDGVLVRPMNTQPSTPSPASP